MKQAKLLFLLIVALAFASCGSDEPRYADPEAHEKTVQLDEKYAPLMVGTWHYEKIGERHRYFERLTFKDDGTASWSLSTARSNTQIGRMQVSPQAGEMRKAR